MSKFIELHQAGDPYFLNIDRIFQVEPSSTGGTVLETDFRNHTEFIEWDESYEDIKKMLGECE